jgi:hypothetical protein
MRHVSGSVVLPGALQGVADLDLLLAHETFHLYQDQVNPHLHQSLARRLGVDFNNPCPILQQSMAKRGSSSAICVHRLDVNPLASAVIARPMGLPHR